MAVSIQTAQSSGVDNPRFSTILAAALSRIVNGVPAVDASKVRVAARGNDTIHEYFAEDSVTVRVRAPEPFSPSGAGRYGTVVERLFDVFVVTQSLLDPADRDNLAVMAHSDREEDVINCLLLNPPGAGGSAAYSGAVGRTIHWVGGGEDILRDIKVDPGLLISALVFKVVYPLRTQVYRA
jgi:hypothetical protein